MEDGSWGKWQSVVWDTWRACRLGWSGSRRWAEIVLVVANDFDRLNIDDIGVIHPCSSARACTTLADCGIFGVMIGRGGTVACCRAVGG
jgi:hypothetical protein